MLQNTLLATKVQKNSSTFTFEKLCNYHSKTRNIDFGHNSATFTSNSYYIIFKQL